MESITLAAAIMGGLGLLFGTILAVAYRLLKVEEDPRIEQVEGMLPGTNCGACGEAGCYGFALQLVAGAKPPSLCTVSSPDAVEAIAEALGVDPGAQDKRVARLHCAGGRGRARQIADYEGFDSCRAAAIVGGGGKGCAWGCLGLGDCEIACTFDAIRMSGAEEAGDGLPVVDVGLCTACGDCVDECPRDLFELLPLRQPLLVQCRIPLGGEAATALCAVACDACGRCAQDGREGLIRMAGNLPAIDVSLRAPRDDPAADQRATLRCPTGAIQWVPGDQFRPIRSGS